MSSLLEEARLAVELDEQARRQNAAMEAERIFRAMMLAPTVAICAALLRGESVPLDGLDPDWVRRFGMRA